MLVTRGEPVKFYLSIENIFYSIESSHVGVGNDGKDRLFN